MRSHSSSFNFCRSGFLRPRYQYSLLKLRPSLSNISSFRPDFSLKLSGSTIRKDVYNSSRHRLVSVANMDGDSVASFSLDDTVDSDGFVGYALSSSEGEESDGDIILNPITDVDLPTARERFRQTDDAITVTAYELSMLGRGQKKSRIKYGIFINVGLVTFLTVLLLLLDCFAWRIVRLPLPPFHLLRPFSTSAVLVSSAGYFCVP